ncbi:MAG: ATP-binding protein [Azoarcus sp.]|nr:ATP-binding protein [Azoarcus sp.]
MQRVLDILSSGVHDAKNQLFRAESLLVQAEAEHGITLGEARYAIELAALRLSGVLATYKLQRHVETLSIGMASAGELIEEVVLVNREHCDRLGLEIIGDSSADEPWPLDRDLVLDILSNALQNASRFARRQIRMSACHADGFLLLRIEDDGPGFEEPDIDRMAKLGVGLFVARELAALHRRHDRHGRVELRNGGELGGAIMEVWLP